MNKPNIIIIVLDEVRAKNLSLYGYPKEFDENIKKIASESLVFTKHISTANGSWPSSTSLFSGLYPPNHGIIRTMPYTTVEEIDKLRKIKFWLPLQLQKLEYDTYLLSGLKAWFKKGFNFVKGAEKSKDTYRKINNNILVKKIIKIIPDWFYISLKKLIKRDKELDFPKPGEMVNLAISKIKEAKKPFFMFIHFEDAHYPWATTPTPKLNLGKSIKDTIKNIKSDEQRKFAQRRLFNVDAKNFEEVEAKYNKSIEMLDRDVGKIYDLLKKDNLWNNTILIILGDHGLSISEHEIHIHHAGLYGETIHVPLIMHIPGIKHKEIYELVQNVDIAPTILELLNYKKIKCDGKSLLPLIKNGKQIRNRAFSFDGSCFNRWCIQTKQRKLIFSPIKKCLACKAEHCLDVEEYDLKNDPKELNNLNSAVYPMMNFNPDIKIENLAKNRL